ncbi:DUF4380 domain-containing protein [Microbulbifer sp. GL-2]|uniref:DUF4380 domain-containing protein n=1 Tax=Microbulbifer sp. GL-2 TaxID=2591606 RepID=UPI001163A5B7|nr:DUF4380 domain-containing protein [Microbulbifer sp. GL-2]BBM02629.1 hypothetical protein GL2_27030 [Microbulbifer sp. GL-2]
MSIAVETGVGGRVTALRYKGIELLSGRDTHPTNFGSTFWISPQSLWGWPPIAAHDSKPYQILKQSDQELSLAGPMGDGASIKKHFSLVAPNMLQLDYQLEVTKDFEVLAAWEITRVPSNGHAFAPVNTQSVKTVRGRVDYELHNDVLWLPLDSAKPLVEGKVIANGSEGWLAYINSGLLYVKLYPAISISQMAPGEGDIELYLSGAKPYLELEIQSATQMLKAGERLDWRTHWLIMELPHNISVEAGSGSLVNFVRGEVKRMRQIIRTFD